MTPQGVHCLAGVNTDCYAILPYRFACRTRNRHVDGQILTRKGWRELSTNVCIESL